MFLGTEYVSPLTIFKDYGSSANPYDVGGSDLLLQTEVISSVVGDKTEAGDMPSSGSYQYSSRAVGIMHVPHRWNVSCPHRPHSLESSSSGCVTHVHPWAWWPFGGVGCWCCSLLLPLKCIIRSSLVRREFTVWFFG